MSDTVTTSKTAMTGMIDIHHRAQPRAVFIEFRELGESTYRRRIRATLLYKMRRPVSTSAGMAPIIRHADQAGEPSPVDPGNNIIIIRRPHPRRVAVKALPHSSAKKSLMNVAGTMFRPG